MKDKIKDRILLLQYVAFSITVLVLISTNISNSNLWVMLLLLAMLIFSFYIRNTFLYLTKYKNMASSIFILDLILIFMVIPMDFGTSSNVILFILISDMTLNYRISYGFILSLIGYIGYAFYLRHIMADEQMITFFKEALKFFCGIYDYLFRYFYIKIYYETE